MRKNEIFTLINTPLRISFSVNAAHLRETNSLHTRFVRELSKTGAWRFDIYYHGRKGDEKMATVPLSLRSKLGSRL